LKVFDEKNKCWSQYYELSIYNSGVVGSKLERFLIIRIFYFKTHQATQGVVNFYNAGPLTYSRRIYSWFFSNHYVVPMLYVVCCMLYVYMLYVYMLYVYMLYVVCCMLYVVCCMYVPSDSSPSKAALAGVVGLSLCGLFCVLSALALLHLNQGPMLWICRCFLGPTIWHNNRRFWLEQFLHKNNHHNSFKNTTNIVAWNP
jgi:hypothetical protein